MNDFKKQKLNPAEASKTKMNYYEDDAISYKNVVNKSESIADIDNVANSYKNLEKKSESIADIDNVANSFNNVDKKTDSFVDSDKKYRPYEYEDKKNNVDPTVDESVVLKDDKYKVSLINNKCIDFSS